MKRIEEKLKGLKEAQKSGTYTLCPRCGRPTMKPELYTNALSRLADIMVCDECGISEAKMAFMQAPGSIYSWVGLRPETPASDFKAIPGEQAWKRICDEQLETISELHRRFLDGEPGAEIRLQAFESCPGLTQMWTEPYQMRYAASDGEVVIWFKKTDEGYDVLGTLVEGGRVK